MSQRFGVVALRHAGLAAQTLGWRPVEFWAATPAEFAASLGLVEPGSDGTIDRDALERMMDRDDGRSG